MDVTRAELGRDLSSVITIRITKVEHEKSPDVGQLEHINKLVEQYADVCYTHLTHECMALYVLDVWASKYFLVGKDTTPKFNGYHKLEHKSTDRKADFTHTSYCDLLSQVTVFLSDIWNVFRSHDYVLRVCLKLKDCIGLDIAMSGMSRIDSSGIGDGMLFGLCRSFKEKATETFEYLESQDRIYEQHGAFYESYQSDTILQCGYHFMYMLYYVLKFDYTDVLNLSFRWLKLAQFMSPEQNALDNDKEHYRYLLSINQNRTSLGRSGHVLLNGVEFFLCKVGDIDHINTETFMWMWLPVEQAIVNKIILGVGDLYATTERKGWWGRTFRGELIHPSNDSIKSGFDSYVNEAKSMIKDKMFSYDGSTEPIKPGKPSNPDKRDTPFQRDTEIRYCIDNLLLLHSYEKKDDKKDKI